MYVKIIIFEVWIPSSSTFAEQDNTKHAVDEVRIIRGYAQLINI